jgi:hypothetical protein
LDDKKFTPVKAIDGLTSSSLGVYDAGVTLGQIFGFTMRTGITPDSEEVSNKDLSLTYSHEAGHSGGLNHLWSLNKIEKMIKNNLEI